MCKKSTTHPPDPPRVWWVGSGIAASFPFHAAGVAFDSQSRQNTLARIIPSYTPTIKALAYTRERAARTRIRDDDPKETHSVLLVAMPTTPGHQPLPGVEAEMAVIREACGGANGAATFTVEALQRPTAAEALDNMTRSSIVHFACHGSSDGSSPSGSHLVLQKRVGGELVVDKLTALAVSTSLARGEQRAWIAFLSACSSAEIAATHFADEGMHLASAFQLAGFPHVVGALWSANDDVCADVARTFYAHLVMNASDVTERSVAVALWHAVRKVRDQYHHNPHLWAPFVHFGA
jgi:CHAT domain-containing protein